MAVGLGGRVVELYHGEGKGGSIKAVREGVSSNGLRP